MKYMFNFLLLIFLASCASEKMLFSGKAYDSAVDLTKNFYDFTFAGDGGVKYNEVSQSNKGKAFRNRWCMSGAATKEEYLQQIDQNCRLHGGALIQNKWCISTAEDKLKYVIAFNDPAEPAFFGDVQPLKCTGSNEIGIYINEPTPASNMTVPIAVSCPAPFYPTGSLRANEEGVVTVQMQISSEGKVIGSKVEKSSGFARLDEAAIKSFSRCAYVPKIESGVPVEGARELRQVWKISANQ